MEIVVVNSELVHHANRLLREQLQEHNLPADAARVSRATELALLTSSTAWLLLARREGDAAGVLLANPLVSAELGGMALWVEELFVDVSHRRKGVALALMQHVIERARREKMVGVDLEVTPGHEAAEKLYARLGFKVLDRKHMTLAL